MMEQEERKKTISVVAPMSGQCAPLFEGEQNGGKLFGITGDGVRIEPGCGAVVAPVTGDLLYFAPTNHAFCVRTSEGFLVHVIVGDGDPDRRGFTRVVRPNEHVTVGEKVIAADLGVLKARGRSAAAAVLLEAKSGIERIEIFEGEVRAGESVVLSAVYGESAAEPKRTAKRNPAGQAAPAQP